MSHLTAIIQFDVMERKQINEIGAMGFGIELHPTKPVRDLKANIFVRFLINWLWTCRMA